MSILLDILHTNIPDVIFATHNRLHNKRLFCHALKTEFLGCLPRNSVFLLLFFQNVFCRCFILQLIPFVGSAYTPDGVFEVDRGLGKSLIITQ